MADNLPFKSGLQKQIFFIGEFEFGIKVKLPKGPKIPMATVQDPSRCYNPLGQGPIGGVRNSSKVL
jgi:hypothetical protein